MTDINKNYNSLSVILHEMRSPINTVIGLSDLAKQSINNKEELENYLYKIKSVSNYILSLTNNFLDFCKNINGEDVSCDKDFYLGDVINELITIFEVQASLKGVNFITLDENHINYNLKGDSFKLKQILANLLSNAIKFTPKGGHVNFNCDITEEKEKIKLKFIISDSGIGINDSFLRDIFKPYTQESPEIKKNFGGTGLGMMIVKKLLSLVNGDIIVNSEKGKGTTFIVNIEYEKVKFSKDYKFNFHGKRILIVDDSIINLEIICDFLKDTGILIETASNGQEAIDKIITSDHDYYNLVIMDMLMPVVDGIDATKIIRNSYRDDLKNLKIIACSSNCLESDYQEAFKAGMNDYLIKPVDYHSLQQIIIKYI